MSKYASTKNLDVIIPPHIARRIIAVSAEIDLPPTTWALQIVAEQACAALSLPLAMILPITTTTPAGVDQISAGKLSIPPILAREVRTAARAQGMNGDKWTRETLIRGADGFFQPRML